MRQKQPQQAFTVGYSGISNRIVIPVQVSNPVSREVREYPAVIDTGATRTNISGLVVQELALTSVQRVQNNTAAGASNSNAYVVHLSMNNGQLVLDDHLVIEANLSTINGIEMLIGMDILNAGDFVITNHNGKTIASFRTPSTQVIDFIGQANMINQAYYKSQQPPITRRRKKRAKRNMRGRK